MLYRDFLLVHDKDDVFFIKYFCHRLRNFPVNGSTLRVQYIQSKKSRIEIKTLAPCSLSRCCKKSFFFLNLSNYTTSSTTGNNLHELL